MFLRTTVPAYGSYHLGSYDVKFEILEGNVEDAFDIIKRIEHGIFVGEYLCFDLWFVKSRWNKNDCERFTTAACTPSSLGIWGLRFLSVFLVHFFFHKLNSHVHVDRGRKHRNPEPSDISASDTTRYGLCNVVASCSCHHLHGGSRSLESCPLSGSLRQTEACFCLTKYLASIFTALRLNKVPFNSLIHGYAYPPRSLLSTMSVCTGIEYIYLHFCIHTHINAWITVVAIVVYNLFGGRLHAGRALH